MHILSLVTLCSRMRLATGFWTSGSYIPGAMHQYPHAANQQQSCYHGSNKLICLSYARWLCILCAQGAADISVVTHTAGCCCSTQICTFDPGFTSTGRCAAACHLLCLVSDTRRLTHLAMRSRCSMLPTQTERVVVMFGRLLSELGRRMIVFEPGHATDYNAFAL